MERTCMRTPLIAIIAAFLIATCLGIAGCNGSTDTQSGPKMQTVTDDAGRTVDIPVASDLTRVYCSTPIAEVAMFAFAPEKLAGTNSNYSEAQLKYLPDSTRNLPNYGTRDHGGTLDIESIMAADVQMILTVSNRDIDEGTISSADELQDQTGIPVLLYNGSVEKTPDAYRSIGKVFDMAERGEKLATYCEETGKRVASAVDSIPESERTRVYYAEGPEGLKTEPQKSPHFITFGAGGAVSVADCEMQKGSGMTEVSLENVITWNPDVIIAWSQELRGGADEMIRTNSDWSSINAVRDNKVYTIPCVPFMWGDRPPSVTRYLGMQWMANLLYPDKYDVDMVNVTKEFYELFFNVTLTDQDAKDILGNQQQAA